MWLDFEPQLIARLQAKLDASIAVLSARDLAGVKEQLQAAPSVHVYPGAYRTLTVSPDGRVATVMQQWLCVVVVRNSTTQRSGSAARADADSICDAVLQALLGFPATDPADIRLHLVNAPTPAWTPGGFGYYPLVFERRAIAAGTP